MSELNFKIPLKYKAGEYTYKELACGDEFLEIQIGEYEVLEYEVPKFEGQVRMYSVDADQFRETMLACYDENEILSRISYKCDDVTRLVYINLTDQTFAENVIEAFVTENVSRISNELLKKEGKISRLFFEYFYDGEAADYAAKIGYQSDMQKIIDSYDGCLDALDNSGDYPFENRVECDNDTLAVMLMCADREVSGDMFYNICKLMTEKIKNSVLDKLDKTEDFKFIEAEYD